MTSGQLIAVIVAIVGGDGIWRVIEHRLSRKDHLKDREHKSIEDFESDLDRCSNACKKMLAYILMPWQEHVIGREEKFVGIHEYEVMKGLVGVYRELGGNGVVKNRQEYIDTYTRVPDVDVEEVERNDLS